MKTTFGPVLIECPECGQQIGVPVKAHIRPTPGGQQELVLTPDMADLWAHSWTHMPPDVTQAVIEWDEP